MKRTQDRMPRISRRRTKVQQRVSLAALERAGSVPENVVRLQPKRRPSQPWPTANGDPGFIAWQALYMVLSPQQKDDAARILRVLSGGKMTGFVPAE